MTPVAAAVAETGTSAAPKPSPAKRTTVSDVLSSKATVRATPARSNAASTWRRSPDSARISMNCSGGWSAGFAVRRLLVAGLLGSSAAAVVLVVVVTAGAGLGVLAVLPPLLLVVATRGLVSSNATVLGVERGSRSAGSASAVLGACMFGGGVLVTPLVGLGPEGSPVPMALVVAGGAIAALLATVLLTRSVAAPAMVAPSAP